jgi:hypothetical protein
MINISMSDGIIFMAIFMAWALLAAMLPSFPVSVKSQPAPDSTNLIDVCTPKIFFPPSA